MRAVGVVPARWASSRLPAKMLADLGGKPLVARTLLRVAQATELDAVLLATDDPRIASAAASTGAIVKMTRADHASGSDRIAEALTGVDADIVVNIQGDEPLIDPALIDALVRRLRAEPSLEMATASTPITQAADLTNPSVVKVVTDLSGVALYFSRSLIPACRDADPAVHLASGIYQRHLGIYAYRRAFLMRFVQTPPAQIETLECLEQLRALAMGARIAVLRTSAAGVGVDTAEDLERVRNLIAGKGTQ